MRGTRHSEEQIIAILKRGEAGLTTAELCRQHGIIFEIKWDGFRSLVHVEHGRCIALP